MQKARVVMVIGLFVVLAAISRVDADPYFLVASGNTHSVLLYNQTGDFLEEFISSRSGGLRNSRAAIWGPDGNVYVSSVRSPGGITGVLRYDGVSGEFINVFAAMPGENPFGLAFGPDGDLYVANIASNNVLRFDGATGVFLGVFASGGGLIGPRDLVFGSDGHLYVSSVRIDGVVGSGKVIRYNGTTGALIGDFALGVDARGLVFGPDGDLYVASFDDNSVLRFDGTTGVPLGTFALDGGLAGPVGLLFAPDRNLYVGSFNDDRMLRYDGGTGTFVDEFISSGEGGLSAPRLFSIIQIIPVVVEIKPGAGANPISPTRRGRLPVAILGSASFDVTTIDPSSLRLSGASVSSPGKSGKLMCHVEDVSGGPRGGADGWLDLVCQFNTSELVLEEDADTAVLTGRADGVPIRGQDRIVQLDL